MVLKGELFKKRRPDWVTDIDQVAVDPAPLRRMFSDTGFEDLVERYPEPLGDWADDPDPPVYSE